MRIIFLDFDGVLNSYEYFHAKSHTDKWVDTVFPEPVHRVEHRSQYEIDLEMLDSAAFQPLNLIVANTDAKVVVSSSWRWGRTQDELAKLLKAKGFRGEVVGTTPKIGLPGRGHEIDVWLEHELVESFVILDDFDDMDPYMDRLVQTELAVGLTRADAAQAIAVLERPL